MDLATEAGTLGGTCPAVLNAANEVAVEAFLSRRIAFPGIWKLLAEDLEKCPIPGIRCGRACWQPMPKSAALPGPRSVQGQGIFLKIRLQRVSLAVLLRVTLTFYSNGCSQNIRGEEAGKTCD